MSVTSVCKSTEKLEEQLENLQTQQSRAYLISDSKGRCVGEYLERRDFLDVIYKGGAHIGEEEFPDRLRPKIAGKENPLVLVWLGTCDLTELTTRGRLMGVKDYNEENLKQRESSMKEDIEPVGQNLLSPVSELQSISLEQIERK